MDLITIRMKKGLDLNAAGRPAQQVERLMSMDRVGVCPSAIPHIKPKLLVRINDRVKLGTPLFTDKRNPDILFVSPGGGTVEVIDFGPRRVIRAIVIRLDKEEAREEFNMVDRPQLAAMPREEVTRRLLAGGLWPLIRALPFRDIADPAVTPPAIIVNLDSLDPFHSGTAQYLNGVSESFFSGLEVLKRLAPEIHLVICQEAAGLPPELNRLVTHRVTGLYPADDPGVFLYYTRQSSAANRSWYIHGREVLLLGRFLLTGIFPTERMVAVSAPTGARHVVTRAGAPLALLAPEINNTKNFSAVAGGLWRGRVIGPEDHLGFYDAALTVLPSGNRKSFLGFMRPGWNKPSHSRTFLSLFNRGPLALDTGRHGEERACVNCGSCASVCPVDILPQFTVKAVLAGEIEEALTHGLLDCVECGVCAYVCPSKVELVSILQQARHDYYREQAANKQ